MNGDTQAQQVAIYAEDSTIYSAAPVSSSPTTSRYHRFPVFACINPEAQRSAEIAATCAAALALGELPECIGPAELLGIDVRIRAQPTEFTREFGDGAIQTTSTSSTSCHYAARSPIGQY
ncbi:hypothetical protein [Paraoerskovia marina]|uniref:hypothetical protein n=1 Tax=Paraoerskovia marina TaxID=545619 RepID=UPI0012FAFD37|nr:hypothetical protein [Paraoerskovia marina]